MTLTKDNFLIKDIGKAYAVTGDLVFPTGIFIILDKPLFVDGNITAFGEIDSNTDLHCSGVIKAGSIGIEGNLKCDSLIADLVLADKVEVIGKCTVLILRASSVVLLDNSEFLTELSCDTIHSGRSMSAKNFVCNSLFMSGRVELHGRCKILKAEYKDRKVVYRGIAAEDNWSSTIFDLVTFISTNIEDRVEYEAVESF